MVLRRCYAMSGASAALAPLQTIVPPSRNGRGGGRGGRLVLSPVLKLPLCRAMRCPVGPRACRGTGAG
eukprot:2670464-Rhodomonas_salina.2